MPEQLEETENMMQARRWKSNRMPMRYLNTFLRREVEWRAAEIQGRVS